MAGKRKRKTRAVSAQDVPIKEEAAEAAQVLEPSDSEDAEGGDDGLTPYEMERQRIIQRNRERLMALGIPTLVATLQETAAARPKKKAGKMKEKATRVKREPGEQEQPLRRSSRLQQVQMSEAERFEFEVGQFGIEGECPRCGVELMGNDNQRRHLEQCKGPERKRLEERPTVQRRRDVEMTEEERKDLRKRTLARMKQLSLENLVEFNEDNAKFVVLGSTGNHYTVTLSNDKQTCQCMDFRFRRHQCKHICLALSHLGILDDPSKWHQAVESKLSDMVKAEAERDGREPRQAQPPRGKAAEAALKFL